MSPCEEYTELISAKLDGELSPFEEKRLEAHLAQCPACRELVRELTAVHEAVAQLPPVTPPADLKDRISDAVARDNVIPMTRKKAVRWKSWAATAAVLAVVLAGAGMSGLFGQSPARPQEQPQTETAPAVFTVGLDQGENPDAGLARTAIRPEQDVLSFCAARLFDGETLAAEPVYDPDTAALRLELTGRGVCTLTCTEADPEGVSLVEVLTPDEPQTTLYEVDLIRSTVTPAN